MRLSYRLVAVGLLGLGLTLFVLQSAVGSFTAESRARSSAGLISRAQRYHQDADQAHDALHADVLDALRVGRAGDAKTGASVQAALKDDAAVFRTNVGKVATLRLGGPLGRELAGVRPAQLHYVSDAERLGALALRDQATADSELPPFDGEFLDLVRKQGAVTSHLSAAVEATRADADTIQRAAERRIIIACLIAVGVLVGLSVVLARLGERLSRLVGRERGVAETLARSMLPDTLPSLPGLAMAARYLPTGQGTQIGGDWYDVLVLDDGQLTIMIGDVLGHDLAAAAVMGQLRIAGRAYALEGVAPAEVMSRLNTLLLSLDHDPMATCLYLQIDILTSVITAVGAGHCWPLLITGATAESVRMPPGPPLGALPHARYAQRAIETPPGSSLLLYTDGLVERRDESLDAGLERLVAAVTRPPAGPHPSTNGVSGWSLDPDRLCDALIGEFFATVTPTDDVAVLALTFAADQAAPVTLRYPASPDVIPELRHTLGRWLHAAGADDDECFDLTVAVAEAAGNAIEHAYAPLLPSTFTVTCALHGDTVTVTVTDTGSWRDPRGEGRGNGIPFIAALTDDVSVDRAATGTAVTIRKRIVCPRTATPSAAGPAVASPPTDGRN